MFDAPVLVKMSVKNLIEKYRPGSHDWGWVEEYADLLNDPVTNAVRKRVESEGIGFSDTHSPILLGNDGRVWDGHHRICIALERGIDTVMVEVA